MIATNAFTGATASQEPGTPNDRSRLSGDETTLAHGRREWLRTVLAAQDDDRQRLARDLHDHIGHHLVALSIGVRTLEQAVGADRMTAAARLHRLLTALDRDMHRVAHDLRPVALDDLGLSAALQTYIDQLPTDAALTVDFCWLGTAADVRLPLEIENALYRIVQELLTNVQQHAHARWAGLVVTRDVDQVTLVIDDDGVGFDVASAGSAGRLGLVGIRERATLVRGSVRIDSSAEAGTSVSVSIPIDGARPSRKVATRR